MNISEQLKTKTVLPFDIDVLTKVVADVRADVREVHAFFFGHPNVGFHLYIKDSKDSLNIYVLKNKFGDKLVRFGTLKKMINTLNDLKIKKFTIELEEI